MHDTNQRCQPLEAGGGCAQFMHLKKRQARQRKKISATGTSCAVQRSGFRLQINVTVGFPLRRYKNTTHTSISIEDTQGRSQKRCRAIHLSMHMTVLSSHRSRLSDESGPHLRPSLCDGFVSVCQALALQRNGAEREQHDWLFKSPTPNAGPLE